MLPLLSWQAPPECPDAAAMQSRLEKLANAASAGEAGAREVRGRVHSTSSGWELELEISGSAAGAEQPSTRRRHLTAPHCDELADAAAIAITFALGATGSEEPPPTPAGVNEAAPAASTPLDSDSPAREQTEPEHVHHSSLALGAGVIADSGLLSAVTGGATLGLATRFDAWGLDVYGVWLSERTQRVGANAGVSFGALGAGLRACYRAVEGELGLDGCAGVELDGLSATSFGLASRSDARSALFAPVAGAALSWRALQPWSVVSRLEALAPRPSQRYLVDAGEQVHATPGIVVRLSLALEADLLRR